jgi:GntR family transcriptional regulator
MKNLVLEDIDNRPLSPFQRLQCELAKVIAGTKPGDRLPSEPKLAHSLGVSRATLREAMRAFEGQGLIRRRQGVGTFVVGPANVIESGLEILESIETQSKKIGLEVTMGEFEIQKIEADEKIGNELGVEKNTQLVQVSRVILADDRPIAYLIDILPESVMGPEDLETGFTGSVLDQLIKSNKYPLSKSKTIIRAVAASSSIARALEIQRGDVLQLFVGQLFDENGIIIDYSHSYFLPGYFNFHVVRSIGSNNIFLPNIKDQ